LFVILSDHVDGPPCQKTIADMTRHWWQSVSTVSEGRQCWPAIVGLYRHCRLNVAWIIIIFLAHQHKAAGMKIKISKNNDHDGILLGVKSA